jgi:imidazole glycerol-phosphate synthase subunit HisH
MKATVYDGGVGNLHSLGRALAHVGVQVETTSNALSGNGLLVLPGVGAFGAAADTLAPVRAALSKSIHAGRPVVGICLGMQLLFDASAEDGLRAGRGLGVLAGTVTALRGKRVPHMGWTMVEPLGQRMYFAHSFACRPADESVVSGWAMHEGERLAASVRVGGIAGLQFHPEKSSADGLALLSTLMKELAS